MPKLVYICTPLAEFKLDLTKITKAVIKAGVFAFIPPSGQLESKQLGAEIDRKMIEMCDELWAFGPIGRDCSWELGYAQGLGKPTKIYIDETNKHLLKEDWMVPSGSQFVVEAMPAEEWNPNDE